MLTVIRLDLIHKIEAAISVPQKGYFVKNERSLRFCYSVEKAIKYINLASVDEVGAFLKKHGIIDSFCWRGNEFKMFTKGSTVIPGPKGEIIWQERLVPFKWEDIQFNQSQVQWFAAVHEFEKAGKVMGNLLKNFQAA